MTREEVVKLANEYRMAVVRTDPKRASPSRLGVQTATALPHVAWMLVQMTTDPTMGVEKLMRWLGFVQGVLWSLGMFTIGDLKQHNKDASLGGDE